MERTLGMLKCVLAGEGRGTFSLFIIGSTSGAGDISRISTCQSYLRFLIAISDTSPGSGSTDAAVLLFHDRGCRAIKAEDPDMVLWTFLLFFIFFLLNSSICGKSVTEP